MKNITFSKKILIVPGLILAVLCVGLYFIFVDIQNKNEQASLLESELSSQSNNQEYIHSMRRMVQDSNSDIARLDSSTLSSDGDVAFIENLEKVAQDNNLLIEINSLGFVDDASAKNSTFTFLKVSAKTKGSWTGTYNFLAELESLPLQVRIDKFAFASKADDSDEKKPSNKYVWHSDFEIRVLKYK